MHTVHTGTLHVETATPASEAGEAKVSGRYYFRLKIYESFPKTHFRDQVLLRTTMSYEEKSSFRLESHGLRPCTRY